MPRRLGFGLARTIVEPPTVPGGDAVELQVWQLVLPAPTDVAAAAANITAKGFAATPEEPGGSLAADPWGTALQLVAAAGT